MGGDRAPEATIHGAMWAVRDNIPTVTPELEDWVKRGLMD